jgi:hypothetical protein
MFFRRTLHTMSTRTRRSGLGIAGALVLVVSSAAFTRENTVPAGLLSPAPLECPTPLVRADSAERSQIGEQLRGHLPPTLPTGFGLMGAWREGDGDLGSALWADGTCRLIWISLWPDGRLPPGPKLGDWVVEESGIHDCGNAVLGDGRCLRYNAVSGGIRIEVFMMGIERDEADGIALSVAT